jgi:signal transduction histidine kinase
MLTDPAAAKQHAGITVEWVLRGVDAMEEQRHQAKRITDRLVDQLGPVVERHQGPSVLHRLVRNLLENARRHGGGADVEAHVERAGTSARLRVADRGPGVLEAERERIFEPFYRRPGASETGASYGLGLALVRQIARAHGGDAQCLPREGGGTVFEVMLGA